MILSTSHRLRLGIPDGFARTNYRRDQRRKLVRDKPEFLRKYKSLSESRINAVIEDQIRNEFADRHPSRPLDNLEILVVRTMSASSQSQSCPRR
jgi:hypothetical protein